MPLPRRARHHQTMKHYTMARSRGLTAQTCAYRREPSVTCGLEPPESVAVWRGAEGGNSRGRGTSGPVGPRAWHKRSSGIVRAWTIPHCQSGVIGHFTRKGANQSVCPYFGIIRARHFDFAFIASLKLTWNLENSVFELAIRGMRPTGAHSSFVNRIGLSRASSESWGGECVPLFPAGRADAERGGQ